MLRRAGVIGTVIVLMLGVLPVASASAHAILPQKCTSSLGTSTKSATISVWRKKKCGPPGGGNSSSTRRREKQQHCPLIVRLPDGSCPQSHNSLPRPQHEFSGLRPTQQSIAAALTLPDATPRFGPDPSVNEWKMLVVGFPIWLWTDGPRQLTTHVRQGGMEFSIRATWQSSRFRMGDGKTVSCGAMTPYRQGIEEPGRPSPTCGYVYQRTSPKGHPYVVEAEESWLVEWSSGGDRGSFVHTYRGSRTLEIGELSSLIVG